MDDHLEVNVTGLASTSLEYLIVLCIKAAMLHGHSKEIVDAVANRLYGIAEDRSVLPYPGPEPFLTNWYKGLPTAYENDEGLPIGYIYWLWWIVRAWGMYSFALKRYGPLEDALKVTIGCKWIFPKFQTNRLGMGRR